jgi:hypothetical protein
MIIQTAPDGTPRLAIMMYEHMALCRQFANAFGNDKFEPLAPLDPMIFVVSNHDAGWAEFDRDPVTDDTTGLPYNLNDTPADYIIVTSRRSPDFNEKQHPFCGLISSMHSWGLYNGRYGLSKLVPIDNIPPDKRLLADRMLAGELERQKRLKEIIAKDPEIAERLDDRRLFQNYKQLQFLDTLALYFNRIHPSERRPQTFENVPLNAEQDIAVTIEPKAGGMYALSPFPFAPTQAEFAFAGRRLAPQDRAPESGWLDVLRTKPTEWERFYLVPGSSRP